MELFYEETSSFQDMSQVKTYKLFKRLSVVFYILAGFWIYFAYKTVNLKVGTLLVILTFLVPSALLLFIGFYFRKKKNNYCVDYDYTLVSGHVRFSKIINSIKRIHLYNFEASSIDKIGKISNSSFQKYSNMPDVQVEYLTSNKIPSENKDLYYIFANIQGQRTVLVIECTELFIINILKFTKRIVLEKDN